MLHELLLCLSGQPSALFDPARQDGKELQNSVPLLSGEEAELLSPIHRIAQIHRALQSHARSITTSHPSVVCRAVAAVLLSSQLAAFQAKIVEVEQRILTRDSSIVGAYKIVPLSGIAAEFSEWIQTLDWYWKMVLFMQPIGEDQSSKQADASAPCSGAAIIDKLRFEARTGYPAIQEISRSLSKVAETTWLRQLSAWILFGRLPDIGAQDFFVHTVWTEDEGSIYTLETKLLPKFVSSRTASSMLFIGKSRNQIRDLGNFQSAIGSVSNLAPDADLHRVHLQHLTDVTTPVSSSRLSDAVAAVRLSLSRNTLQKLLPLPRIIQLLTALQEFFLLGRGEFAMALIQEADRCLESRQRGQKAGQQAKVAPGVSGVLLKDGEVASILSKTWSLLSSYVGDDEAAGEALDFARDLMHLELRRSSSARPSTPGRAKEDAETLPDLSNISFYDVLVQVPANLTMDIPSPLDLFITPSEVNVYSGLHSYLLAIRRSHVHLTGLWKQSSSRREHPAPLGPPHSNLPHGRRALEVRRRRARQRNIDMREIWATCGAAVFLLSEFINYFEGDVVHESCAHFYRWVSRPVSQQHGRAPSAREEPSNDPEASTAEVPPAPHDPETLAAAHRRFLSSLAHLVLLTDVPYTRALRSLLTHIDQLIALIARLQTIRTHLDLEEDEGVVDAMANYEQDEREVRAQLARARRHVDSGLKAVVMRLRELDAERTGYGGMAFVARRDAAGDEYVPLRGGNLDGLLMKLDFGRVAIEGDGQDN